MKNKINLFCFLVFASAYMQAQLMPMHRNQQIIDYRKQIKTKEPLPQDRVQSTPSGFILPFYEEFSYQGPYPDVSKWQNSQSVYINRTKAVAPPTLGVATFDGLDKYGYPYSDNQTIACGNYFNTLGSVPSDTLASVLIRLDSIPASFQQLSPADSIYLSFYYQPMGYYEPPRTNDALILEFYSPNDSIWNLMWQHSGYTPTDSSWHLVMIPITDTSYFKKNFQFRFRNLSAACGDVNHWHLDVVYLNHNRSYTDTIFGDFTFSYNLTSPLKNYSQMPYKQYAGTSDMKTNIGVALRNNYNDVNHQNVSTYYTIYRHTQRLDSTYNGSVNLGYFGTNGFCNNASVAAPSLGGFTYPVITAPDTFYTKFYLQQPSQLPFLFVNDTIKFNQIFGNYYAYDDGSAEAGFGICNDYVAVKYTLNVADTLRAMDIFFDPIYDVKYLKTTSFNINVWGDNGGVPNNTPMYADTLTRYPYFPADTTLPGVPLRVNNFLRYQFVKPVILPAGTTFYIGVVPNSYNPLAVGFDKNNNFYQNMFRYTSGAWYVFPAALYPDYTGSLMIRPVFGDSAATASIQKYSAQNNSVKLVPNPAATNVQVSILNDLITEVKIYDMLGNEVLQNTKPGLQNGTAQIDVSDIANGAYIVKVLSNKGYVSTQKLLISR
ncbi:MAG: T9SS type A sorting domain-containing protein [Bacteroidetes bacterium]|nr:T9SS type A sorting domain-containing protein [Bacteroidota bacterium]